MKSMYPIKTLLCSALCSTLLFSDSVIAFSAAFPATTAESVTEVSAEPMTETSANSVLDSSDIKSESATATYYELTVTKSDISSSGAYAAIQTALNEAKENATANLPYKIIVEPGSYTLSQSLHLYSNTYLYTKGVTIKLQKGSTANMIKVGETDDTQTGLFYKNITVEGGTWDENGNSNTAVKVAHAKNFTLKNLSVQNTKDAHLMEVAGVDGFTLSNCTFKDQVLASTKLYEAIQFDFLISDHMTGYALETLTNKNIVVDGCKFSNVPRAIGSHTSVLNLPITNVQITNNSFTNIKSAAIELLNYTDCKISGNTITKCPRGITLYSIRGNGEGNFLPSSIEKSSGISSKYIAPAKDQNIEITNNTIELSGSDPYMDYENVGIALRGFKYTSAVKPNDGDKLPAGDYYLSGVTISGNTISATDTGILLNNAKNAKISSNKITYSSPSKTFHGILLDTASTDNEISGNTITNAKGSGICVTGSSSASAISDNTITKAKSNGILLFGATIDTISGNTISSCSGSGISSGVSKVDSISSNTIKNAKLYGIEISGGKASEISNNIIKSSKNCGIMTYNKAVVKKIHKNTIQSAKSIGIFIVDAASNLSITSNTVSKCKTSQIQVVSSTGKSKYTYTLTSNKLTGTSTTLGISVSTGKVAISANTIKSCKIPIQLFSTVNGTVGKNTYSKNKSNSLDIQDPYGTHKAYKNLSTPSSVKAKAKSKSSIKVTWKSVKNVDGYYIYRADSADGTYKQIATVKGAKKASYTNTKLKKNTQYYYKVVAYCTSSKNSKLAILSGDSKVTSAKTKK